jgi:hypothetical protein
MDIDAGPAERIRTTRSHRSRELFKGATLQGPVIIQSAAVLEAVKARPGNVGVRFDDGATAGLDSLCARRPKEIYGRDGRKPAAQSNKRKHRSKERPAKKGLDKVPLI